MRNLAHVVATYRRHAPTARNLLIDRFIAVIIGKQDSDLHALGINNDYVDEEFYFTEEIFHIYVTVQESITSNAL